MGEPPVFLRSAEVHDPLLAEANLHRVDRVVGIVGVGLLLVHVAFMVHFCGLLLTVVLMADEWAWRHRLAIGGTGVLTAVFVLLWLYVKTLPLPDSASVFYGIRSGHPPAVLWMNISMGCGLVYIAVWNFVEFTRFLRGARTTYEHGHTAVARLGHDGGPSGESASGHPCERRGGGYVGEPTLAAAALAQSAPAARTLSPA